MTFRELVVKRIETALQALNEDTVIGAWNMMCGNNGDGERMIHPMSMFDTYETNLFDSNRPLEIIRSLEDYENFDTEARYYFGDDNGNRYSTDAPLFEAVNFTELAIAIADYKISLNEINVAKIVKESKELYEHQDDKKADDHSELRSYNDVNELPWAIGDAIRYRDKTTMRQSLCTYDGAYWDAEGEFRIIIGKCSWYAEYMFRHFEYRSADGQWCDFGMPKEK